jgi:FtsZ-binding cell division protein ZapB
VKGYSTLFGDVAFWRWKRKYDKIINTIRSLLQLQRIARAGMANKLNLAKNSGSAKRQGFTAKPQAAKTDTATATETAVEPATIGTDDSIAILQANLATAQAKEATFQITIDQLEAKLNQQAETIQLLRTQLEQSQTLQAALDKAEAAARQLAQLNETLLAENNSLKAVAAPTSPEIKAPEPKTAEPKTAEPKKSQTALATRRDRPVFKEGAPGGLTEKDIGWFD